MYVHMYKCTHTYKVWCSTHSILKLQLFFLNISLTEPWESCRQSHKTCTFFVDGCLVLHIYGFTTACATSPETGHVGNFPR